MQKSIDRSNRATKYTKGSNSTKIAIIADNISIYNTGNTTKNYTANNPRSSITKDLALKYPRPIISTI